MHPATPLTLLKGFLFSFASLIAFFFAFPVRAQNPNVARMDDCSGGTLFYVAFPDTTQNEWDARFPSSLIETGTKSFAFYLYSPVDQEVRIGSAGDPVETVSLTGGRFYEYEATNKRVPLITVINTSQKNVLKIEAQYPIIVYGYMLTPFGAEAYAAIPVESWGTEYYAATWPGQMIRDVFPHGEFNYRTAPHPVSAQTLIVAAYDSTRVTINVDPDMLLDCEGCTEVTLKAGEAYLVQSAVDTAVDAVTQPDLGGTLIASDKPIGVISGNSRLMLNAGVRPALAENSFKNLVMEWLPPVEQHGTEFVFTPTWDDRRQRAGLDPDEARAAERVRLFATSTGGGETIDAGWYDDMGDTVPTRTTPLRAGEFTDENIGAPVARAFTTSGPAFAVAVPESVVKFNGTTTYGQNFVGASYLSWSTYMVELVPREQWTSFAPVHTPALPSGMFHYLNVVTDTGNMLNVYIRGENGEAVQFLFDQAVPGTDLVWGTTSLERGADYSIESPNGGRFTGHVYGSYRGQEQYRPGGARRDDSDGKSGVVTGGDPSNGPAALHPSEYEEDVALMYGFPLVPSRCALTPSGTYTVETETVCGIMTIRITGSDGDGTPGLRSIGLVPDSSSNVALGFLSPADPVDVINRKDAMVRLVPMDPAADAHAVVVIRDRSRNGQPVRVEYTYTAERLEMRPGDALEFTDTRQNETAAEKSVTIVNPTQVPLTLHSLSFSFGNQEFRIKRTEPSFDWNGGSSIELSPGDSIVVWLDITPRDTGRTYHDSLRIGLGCRILYYPLYAFPAEALDLCLTVDDLDFGVVEVDRSRTLDLELCNRGEGDITFHDPWVTWLGNDFGVALESIDALKGKTLRKGECITLRVMFSAGDTGTFRTVARFWANTRDCRDTSIWKVRVVDNLNGVAGDEGLAGYAIRGVTPNPLTHQARIDFRLGRSGETTVEVYNSEGERTATLVSDRMEAGEHHIVWSAEGYAAGLYHIRIRSGAWSGTRQVILVR